MKKLTLFDTYTRDIKPFSPLKNREVRIYACGPTVYKEAHIGNLSTYIFVDFLVRYLKFLGYKTMLVRNITDVGHLTSNADTGEDKLEVEAKKAKVDPLKIAEKFTKKFHDDCEKLNLLKPDKEPHAVQNIKEQIEAVGKLIKKGFAYETKSGIYFDTSKDREYGKLSGLKNDKKLKTKSRVGEISDKKNPLDFALWLKAKGKFANHLQNWDSPWGVGFPGWHIECSVMSKKILDVPFDIHTGGVDHIPIHHTNEIAQSKALYRVNPANFWVHHEFLQFGGKKMAKSKGESITLDDLEKEEFSPQDFKFLVLSAHYRTKLNFSFDALSQAQKNLQTISEFIEATRKYQNTSPQNYREVIFKDFYNDLCDDLNTPSALGRIFILMKIYNKKMSANQPIPKVEIVKLFIDLEKIFGIDFKIFQKKLPQKAKALIKKREELRQKGKFAEADKLRTEITKLGVEIKDTDNGTEWKFKN